MARILIVEDEAMLRASVARGLARITNAEVDAVGSVSEAVASIERRPPDLLISDIDLPDRLGLELLGELARRGLRCPVIFVSAYLRAYGSQIPPNSGVEVLEKPVSLQTLREVVLRRLEDAQPDTPFSVVDYIQLACMARRSVRIELRTERSGGVIAIKDGTLWAAEDEQGDGVSAFQRLAFQGSGRVECTSLREDPGPRSIFDSWESLLMDGARFLDESTRDLRATGGGSELALEPSLEAPASPEPLRDEPPPSSGLAPRSSRVADSAPLTWASPEPRPWSSTAGSRSGRFEAPPRPAPPLPPEPTAPEDPFAIVWDRGLLALLERRYEEALQAFVEARAINPNDRKVQANIARLEAMGYRASEEAP